MRPYTFSKHRGRYDVCGVSRPNRLAAGMQATHERRQINVARSNTELRSDDHARAVLALLVHGTTDTLAGMLGNRMKRHRSKFYRVENIQRWVRKVA